jgi:pimeloyl-ACP methyl ester carboxylesterase
MRYTNRQGSSEYLKLLGYKRYHYLAWPRVSSTRLVLLHGRGECADIWTAFASNLTGSADIIAFDLRGHGGTPWDPDSQYELDDYIEDLCLQIRHWNRPSILIGHGLGAQIAMRAAKELDNLTKALVVIDPDIDNGKAGTLVDSIAADNGQFHDALRERLFQELTWARPGTGRTPKCDPAALEKVPSGAESANAPQVSQPALVVSSDNASEPTLSNDLKKTLPNGQLASIPTSGWPHIKSAAETAETNLQFLQTIET